jgi:hypothetical protein
MSGHVTRSDTPHDTAGTATEPAPPPVTKRHHWRLAAVAVVVVLAAGAVDLVGFRHPESGPAVNADAVVGTSQRPSATPTPSAALPSLPPLKPGATSPPATGTIGPSGSGGGHSVPPAAPPTGYPSAANTGVPGGTALTVVNGDYRTARDGQVISGLDIHGVLIVGNDNVTVRNTRIRDRVDYRSTSSGARLTIEDSDLGPDGCPGSAGGPNPSDYPLMYYSGWYTLRRVHLHGDEDLLRTSYGTTLVQDSFLDHTCMYAGAHADAIQQYSPGDVSRVTLIHNTIDGRPANTSGDKGNSAVFWSDHPGAGSSLTAYDNLFAGGNYSVWTTDASAGSGVTVDVHDNQFVRGSYQYGPHNCANSVPFNGREGVKWANNTFSDNRAPITSDCG